VTESISPTAAITIQIKCRNFVIQFSPSGANGIKKLTWEITIQPPMRSFQLQKQGQSAVLIWIILLYPALEWSAFAPGPYG
jgi:hypothetical protein